MKKVFVVLFVLSLLVTSCNKAEVIKLAEPNLKIVKITCHISFFRDDSITIAAQDYQVNLPERTIVFKEVRAIGENKGAWVSTAYKGDLYLFLFKEYKYTITDGVSEYKKL